MRILKIICGSIAALMLAEVIGLPIAIFMGAKDMQGSSSSDGVTIVGDDGPEICWNFLKSKGFSDAGAAGVVGNWYRESGCSAADLEGHSYAGYDDESYGKAVDSGAYTKEQFMHDAHGYGIAQWTYYSRKGELYDYAKTRGLSISSYEAQLGFFWEEFGSWDGKSEVMNATDPKQAAIVFGTNYEMGGSVPYDVSLREQYAQENYEKFKGTSGSGKGSSGCSSKTAASAGQAQAAEYALEKVGSPYVGGACGPDSFDCSGLVYWAYQKAGYSWLPRLTAQGYYDRCTKIEASDLQKGDLVFWDGGWINAGEWLGHVAIYVGDGKAVQAVDAGVAVLNLSVGTVGDASRMVYGRLPANG